MKIRTNPGTIALAVCSVAACLTVLPVAAQDNAVPGTAVAPAQTEMQKWLADLDAQWQAAFKRDVADAYTAENDKLRGQYAAALEAGVTKASGAGDLNAAIVWRNEQKRFAEANGIPAQDDAADAPAVKQLRAAWRSQLPRIETDRATRAKALLAKYDQVLASAQTQLTKGARIDDAILVKAKRDEVAAAWLAGIPVVPPSAVAIGQPKPTTTIPIKPLVPVKPPAGETTGKLGERALADKLKEMGCEVGVSEGAGKKFAVERVVFGRKDWTEEEFKIFDQLGGIRTLVIANNAATDAMIERAHACRKVTRLELSSLPNMTGKGFQIIASMPDLELLMITDVSIDDAGFKSALQGAKFKRIDIQRMGFTDAAMTALLELPTLFRVRLSSVTGLTDAGWLGVGKAKKLGELEIENTRVEVEGFANIAKSRTLGVLGIREIPPTDEHLQPIRTMKQLRVLYFTGGKTTDSFIASLRNALPKTQVSLQRP